MTLLATMNTHATPTSKVAALAALFAAIANLTPAQKAGTTLVGLADRADTVVVARVVRASDPDPMTRAWTFVRQETLRGSAPAAFELREPSGRACGRALQGLLPGQRLLLFLSTNGGATGSLDLVARSSRTAPLASQATVGHVRALLRTTDPHGRARLLVGALTHPEPRIAEDAALALPTLAGLDRLTAAERAPIVSALRNAAANEAATLPSLARTAQRLRLDDDAVDALLPVFLDGRSLRDFYLATLPRFDHGVVARRLASARLATSSDEHRAVLLAARLQTAEVLPLLWRIARTTHSRIAAQGAARALMVRGVRPELLAADVP